MPQTRVVTLSAVFEEGGRAYTFMVHRRLAKQLAPGDDILVDTTAGLRVATVNTVHDTDKRPKGRDDIKWKWAFQKVDKETLKDLKDLEALID